MPSHSVYVLLLHVTARSCNLLNHEIFTHSVCVCVCVCVGTVLQTCDVGGGEREGRLARRRGWRGCQLRKPGSRSTFGGSERHGEIDRERE